MQLLIKSAQKGNKKAFQELVKHYDSQIFSLIMRYTSDPYIAKDIYQEVFMCVYKNIGSFSFRSEFFTWLYRITVNTTLSYIKKESRYTHLEFEQEGDVDDEDRFENYHDINHILKEADKLPEKQKIVFYLRFQNDLKIREIADIMNVDDGTVKGYLSRSLKRIKKTLKIE